MNREKGCEVPKVYKARGSLLTDNEDADEANYAKLHVVVVKENIGEVCCEEGINPTTSTYEVDVRIKYRRTQRT